MHIRFTQLSLLIIFIQAQVCAQTFTSIHVFGDNLSATNDNSNSSTYYRYPGNPFSTFTNGRPWADVFADWQGVGLPDLNNNSFFRFDSQDVVDFALPSFSPSDAATSLAVIWVNNSDIFNLVEESTTNVIVDSPASRSAWQSLISSSAQNHVSILNSLHQKGFQKVVFPSVVRLSIAPRR